MSTAVELARMVGGGYRPTHLDVSRAMLEQHERWARVIDRARSQKRAGAAVAKRFFDTTWNDALAWWMHETTPDNENRRVDRATLANLASYIANAIYPAAERAGFPPSSFILFQKGQPLMAPTQISGPHHGGGHHGGHHHGGGRRRRYGGGGWYGYPYGYPYGYFDDDYNYPDGDVYIDADQVTVSGRHAAAAQKADASNELLVLAPLFVSGFFDSVKNAVLTYTGTKATNQFIKDNHLEPYVMMGAKAISTYYGGPAAGKASDYVTPIMMSLGTKDASQDDAAKAQLAQANQAAAAHSPQASQAMQIAQAAAQKAATAYHVAQITKDAKAGNPAAQQALGSLDTAAKGGDTNAAAALLLAKLIHSAQEKSDTAGTARDPNWQVDPNAIEMDSGSGSKTVGVPSMSATEAASIVEGDARVLLGAAVAVSLRDQAAHAATAFPAPIVGVRLTGNGWELVGFDSVDDADDWFGNATDIAHDYAYAAYFDKADPLFPAPLNESRGTLGQAPVAKGRHAAIQRGAAIASGIPLPLLAATAGAAGYGAYRWYRKRRGTPITPSVAV